MDDVIIASSSADAAAFEAVKEHHTRQAGALAVQVEALVSAAVGGRHADGEAARRALVQWCERDLLVHVTAEERALYPPAQSRVEGRLLVAGLLGEHEMISALVDDLAATSDPIRAAAAGNALLVLLQCHLAKENELLLPLLASDTEIDLSDLLVGSSALPGADEHGESEERGCGGHSCSCGEAPERGLPELDARQIPHAIRHATVFGALDVLEPGGGLVLVAPHDPLPLLGQLRQRSPGAFDVTYLERGPEAWRLQLVRSEPARQSAEVAARG